jgi:hypothetical protein
LYLQDLLSCPDVEELLAFLSLLQCFGVAHEFAHHLRHRYKRFQPDDLWKEEQWANYFAAAFVKTRLSPVEQERGLQLLYRAVVGLSNHDLPLSHLADTYRNPLRAMQILGDIDDGTAQQPGVLGNDLYLNEQQLLEEIDSLPAHLRKRLEGRSDLIAAINSESDKRLVKRMFYTLGWIYLSLANSERQSTVRFIREALGAMD